MLSSSLQISTASRQLKLTTAQIAVAYIDPGNYATNVAAGSSYRFKLLFIVMMSNVIAIYLQSLCIKLGSVSGMDLAQMCRAHFPRWLNYFLYVLAEGSVSTSVLHFQTYYHVLTFRRLLPLILPKSSVLLLL